MQALTVPMAHVLRDGEWKELAARELVPGDVIALKGGDVIPADCQVSLRQQSLTLYPDPHNPK